MKSKLFISLLLVVCNAFAGTENRSEAKHVMLVIASQEDQALIDAAKNNTFSYDYVNTTEIIIQKGDITNCPAQAIVNAANAQLAGGAGVCGSIFKAAGWDALQQACDMYPETNGARCPVGQACITDSFDLKKRKIEHIIHAVGPDCRIITDAQQQDLLLAASYKNSLLLADEYALESIAFPFISSAIYAFPKERACAIALNAVTNFAKNITSRKKVYFVLFSQEDYDLFCKTLTDIKK
jgi:O-acetyl-ADP-ribose deacetylase (regulator of RNase III)